MSTTAAPDSAKASRSCLFVAIREDVIPTVRAQSMPDDSRSVTTESTAFCEQARIGFVASVDLHAVYTTTLPSDSDSVKPPQSPITSTASGLGETDGAVLTSNVAAALLLAFPGPIPLKMRTTS